MIFKIKVDWKDVSWTAFWMLTGLIVLVNAAIYSAIAVAVYFFFQWLGGQL